MGLARTNHREAPHLANHLAASDPGLHHSITLDTPQSPGTTGNQSVKQSVALPCDLSGLAHINHKPTAATCGRQAGTALGSNRGSDSMFPYSPPAILHPPCPSLPRAASRYEVCDLCGLAGPIFPRDAFNQAKIFCIGVVDYQAVERSTGGNQEIKVSHRSANLSLPCFALRELTPDGSNRGQNYSSRATF